MVTAIPILDEEGEVSYVVATARDVTELQLFKEELEKTKILSSIYQAQMMEFCEKYLNEIQIVNRSKKMQEVMEVVSRIGPTDVTVLLIGETGVGKEVIANLIHSLSNRKGPFVRFYCNAVARELVEAELFGYEKGAFTGAYSSKPGLLEVADNGTLFFDEVGDLPYELQGKFLQVLEKKNFAE